MAHPKLPTTASYVALALLACFFTNNTQANTVLEQANNASLKTRTWPQPQWPKTQVAQRAFCGNEIFAERRNGKNYAWVLPNIRDKKKQGDVEIMEFFSNKRVRGRIFEYPGGWYNLEHKFLEKNGVWHRRNIVLEYEGNRSYAGIKWVNNGVVNGKRIVFFQDDIPKNFSVNDFCSPLLHITSTVNEQDGKILFSKVLMHRLFPYKRCPQGRWVSGVSGGIPLGDGTMLVTADQWVFRLNQNDLTPAGNAPALVVLDADQVKAVFKDAERLNIQNMDNYFSKKFDIPTSAYLQAKKQIALNLIYSPTIDFFIFIILNIYLHTGEMMMVQAALTQKKFETLAFWAVGLGSEGSMAGADRAHKLSVASHSVTGKDTWGMMAPNGNSGYTIGTLQTDMGQHPTVATELVQRYQTWCATQQRADMRLTAEQERKTIADLQSAAPA